MLDAFNRKGVRRILDRGGYEHSNQKNEDAITSLVFSPLRYMDSSEALMCLRAALGTEFVTAIGEKQLSKMTLDLWPKNLSARSLSVDENTLTEPDILVCLDFADGSQHIFAGELKWDWGPSQADLQQQIDREYEAVRKEYSGSQVRLFAIVRNRIYDLKNCSFLRWPDVKRGLIAFNSNQKNDTASSRWANDVIVFLEKAGMETFSGFARHACLKERPLGESIFYR